MIIKSTPEDFKVLEIARLPLVPSGPFAVYRLEKCGWNTVDALREISKDLKIPSRLFSYGGKKDRHAQTSQHIAIQHPAIKEYSKGQLHLRLLGFMDRPMGPDLIESNHFEVVLRRLSPKDAVKVSNEAKRVISSGFVNYFDDQRFGSFDPELGFLAEKLLLGHFNGAAKILMTSIHSGDPQQEKARRRFFMEHWKDWGSCLSRAQTEFEKFAFRELQKGEKGALVVLQRVPKEDLSMYFSAFQSFLWNEISRRYIKDVLKQGLIRSDGIAGEYVFYRDIPEDVFRSLRAVSIPTAAHNTRMPEEKLAKIYEDILRERSIKRSMFNKIKVRKAFFKTTERSLIAIPVDLTVGIHADHKQEFKCVILKFTLPRGSYATMLLKRLAV